MNLPDTFSAKFLTTGSDVDGFGNLKPGPVLAMIQRSSELYLRSTPFSVEELLRQGRAWVLVSVTCEIGTIAFHESELTMKTWACPSKAPVFRRDMVFADERGQSVIRAALFSAVIDFNKRRIDRTFDIEGVPVRDEFALEALSRLKLPQDIKWEAPISRHVHNSYIDGIGHVNNARYADIAYNMLTPQEVEKRVRRVHIDFQSEMRLGDSYRISRGARADGAVYFTALNGENERPVFITRFDLGKGEG